MEYTPTNGEKYAISIIENEKANWEEGECWLTDKVSFLMTNIIKKARKNYFGIFDEERDPTTDRKKLFIPMTEWMVKIARSNIDIDLKDLTVDAKRPSKYKMAYFTEHFLKNELEKADFSRKVNDMIDNVLIDGTAWFKTWKENGKLQIRIVDALNMVTDPSDDEDDSPKIERNVLSMAEFDKYAWDNKEYVKGKESYDRTGVRGYESNIQSEIPYVDIYERYGWLPEYCRTELDDDKEKYFYGHLIISGLEGGKPIVHLLEETKEHPYTKFRLKKIKNRSGGRGVPEMLFNIQSYINEVINLRLNVSRIVQMGLWKIRGSITPQQLKKLFSTAAIKLNAQTDDIERLDTGSIDISSYKDETNAFMWAQKVIGQTPTEELPTSKPATNALIQERSEGKGNNQILEELFLDLASMIKYKVAPILRETFKDDDFIRITDDQTVLRKMDEELARTYVYKEIEKRRSDPEGMMLMEQDIMRMVEQGMTLEQAETKYVEDEVAAYVQDLQKTGNKRFPQLKKKMFDFDVDLRIDPSQEQANKILMANQINNAMSIMAGAGVPPSLMKEPMKELFDLMGLDGDKMTEGLEKAEEMRNAQLREQAQIEANAGTTPTEAATMGANL